LLFSLLPCIDEYVRRLEIAMDEASLMAVVQGKEQHLEEARGLMKIHPYSAGVQEAIQVVFCVLQH